MTEIFTIFLMYNTQVWLLRLIASLQKQTLHFPEVLTAIIASTDETAAIADAVATSAPRFRLIRLFFNNCTGAARNKGVSQADGETICFADPDNLLPERALEVRYEAYKKHSLIVRASHDKVDDNGHIRNHETRPSKLLILFSPTEEFSHITAALFLCAQARIFLTKIRHRYVILNEKYIL